MSLKDTLIFVVVCIAAGFVFSGVLNIVFGAISILMIAHFVIYSVTSKYYAIVEQSKKEITEQTVHTLKEG
jgi:4-hydroxybenzoate polyprenyltransferase